MTSVNVQAKDLHGEPQISNEHIANNTAVRDMLVQRGIVPENLPAAEDIKKSWTKIGKRREESFRQQEEKVKMEQNKKELLMEQANKITEVVNVLRTQFGEDFEDEVNYLEIVKKGLEEVSAK